MGEALAAFGSPSFSAKKRARREWLFHCTAAGR